MTLVQPNPDMQVLIRKGLNENVSTRNEDVEHLKQWLVKQPHLPNYDDDARIMTFLRGCKFSLEKAKRKLDMYFTMKGLVPEFFSNRDIDRPELQAILKQVSVPPLSGLTPKGCRVIVMRANNTDCNFSTSDILDAMKVVLMIGDIRLAAESIGVAGDVYILDASIANATHFARFTPAILKKFAVCVQEAYPVKVKEVHIINPSPLVDTLIAFAKHFIKDKIISRVHVHRDGLESLYEFIPREMLPEEYGGYAGPIENFNQQWIEKMREYKGWFTQQEKLKADESKRPGRPKTHDEMFGMEGSFRKLTID